MFRVFNVTKSSYSEWQTYLYERSRKRIGPLQMLFTTSCRLLGNRNKFHILNVGGPTYKDFLSKLWKVRAVIERDRLIEPAPSRVSWTARIVCSLIHPFQSLTTFLRFFTRFFMPPFSCYCHRRHLRYISKKIKKILFNVIFGPIITSSNRKWSYKEYGKYLECSQWQLRVSWGT